MPDRYTDPINGWKWDRDSLVIETTPQAVVEEYVCFANDYKAHNESYQGRSPWDPAEKAVIDGESVPEAYGWGANEGAIRDADIDLEAHLRLRNYVVPERYRQE